LRLGHGFLAGDAGAVLVFGHLQGALVGVQRGLQQPGLLIHDAQLQVALHQLRLLAQAHRGQVRRAGFGAGLFGFQAPAQLAPDIGFPAHAQLRVEGVADAAAGTAEAGVAAAGALAGAGFPDAQVHRRVKRPTGTAHQRLGLAEARFGLGDGLVGVVQPDHEVIELTVAVQLPPGATGQRIARRSLAPALGLLELRRLDDLRARVVGADGASAEQHPAEHQAGDAGTTGHGQCGEN